MSIGKFIIDKDGDGVVLVLEPLGENTNLMFGHLQPRPTVPLESGGFGQTTQAGNKATRRH